MANAKKKLSRIIREIVQQEVEKSLTEIFGNKKKQSAQQVQNSMIEKFNEHDSVSYAKNASLNEALNATANDNSNKLGNRADGWSYDDGGDVSLPPSHLSSRTFVSNCVTPIRLSQASLE